MSRNINGLPKGILAINAFTQSKPCKWVRLVRLKSSRVFRFFLLQVRWVARLSPLKAGGEQQWPSCYNFPLVSVAGATKTVTLPARDIALQWVTFITSSLGPLDWILLEGELWGRCG